MVSTRRGGVSEPLITLNFVMGCDDDRFGACAYVHRDVVVCRRAFPGEGPAAQGPRARRNWPSPRASVPVQGPRLLPSPSPLPFGRRATPERGQMLRRAVCETASNVYQPRPASPDRGHGVRRDDWGRRSEFAVLLRFALAGSSRAVASLLRRTGVDVCRLHVRSPGPWLGIPAKPLCISPWEGERKKGLAPPSILERG